MSNPYFQFQQFTVWHDQCAMKVGTDGTLLGAWAEVDHARRVLDVGTGTALISLMIAQRQQDAVIDAIDLDEAAVSQATENVCRSPFAERIHVRQADFLTFLGGPYDLIVCNPPFFQDSLQCPEKQRTLARHNDTLPFRMLCRKAAEMLLPEGWFCVVLPVEAVLGFLADAAEAKLYLARFTQVCTKEGKPIKRVLMSFSPRKDMVTVKDILNIMDAQGRYSERYRQLTGDFYLKK